MIKDCPCPDCDVARRKAEMGREPTDPSIGIHPMACRCTKCMDEMLRPSKTGSERFHELLKEIGELHDRKQQDYGTDADPFANVRSSSEWGVPAWVGALMRLNDKVVRLKTFAQKGVLANESAFDSFRDIAVYALIGLILYEEQKAENPPGQIVEWRC